MKLFKGEWNVQSMVPSNIAPVIDPHSFRSFCFRGEGRANFVISAKCEKTGLRIAWRLTKHRRSGNVTMKPKCHIVIAYLEKLIVPFLGRQFLVKPKVVEIDTESLHHLAKIPALPFNLKIETFDELCDPKKYPSTMSFFPFCCMKNIRYVSILQMMDATRIPKCLSSRCFGPTITVEIKPKQGFMQNHPGINVPYCNNCILQLEKCHSDAFEQMYDFCPLDLFSGDLKRMRKALNSLFMVPHRNLRIFLDGSLIHSDEHQLTSEQLHESLFRDGSVSVEQLISALCCILVDAPSDDLFAVHDSGVLTKLLNGQRIDTIGIVRAYQIYTSLPETTQKELLDKCLLPRKGITFLHQNTDRALVERYLLAATMKDCSLMISMRLVDPVAFATQNVQSSGQQIVRIVGASGTGYTSFAYSVKIVDLDPKSPKNLLNAYSRFMDGVKLIEQIPNLRRPCVP
uniref:Inositol-pentakisphosphate 2-kinase n=2 Tax=Onchocerca TaxID=6281 RepID=A0A8R1TKX5_ONCVO